MKIEITTKNGTKTRNCSKSVANEIMLLRAEVERLNDELNVQRCKQDTKLKNVVEMVYSPIVGSYKQNSNCKGIIFANGNEIRYDPRTMTNFRWWIK